MEWNSADWAFLFLYNYPWERCEGTILCMIKYQAAMLVLLKNMHSYSKCAQVIKYSWLKALDKLVFLCMIRWSCPESLTYPCLSGPGDSQKPLQAATPIFFPDDLVDLGVSLQVHLHHVPSGGVAKRTFFELLGSNTKINRCIQV